MKQFEVGKYYKAIKETFLVISRTAKTLLLEDRNGNQFRKRISKFSETEEIINFDSETLSASGECAKEEPEEKKLEDAAERLTAVIAADEAAGEIRQCKNCNYFVRNKYKGFYGICLKHCGEAYNEFSGCTDAGRTKYIYTQIRRRIDLIFLKDYYFMAQGDEFTESIMHEEIIKLICRFTKCEKPIAELLYKSEDFPEYMERITVLPLPEFLKPETEKAAQELVSFYSATASSRQSRRA